MPDELPPLTYPPLHAREIRQELLVDAIHQIQFSTLVALTDAGIEATHIPLILRREDGNMFLDGHVARANPLTRISESGVAALAVFQGPHGYIHPGWLETKRQTGKAVPTWNYIVVQARGLLKAIKNEEWLLRHLEQLTDRNEAGRGEPWSLSDAPDGFIDQLMRGIVGLSLQIGKLDGLWKLSANQPQSNREGILIGLESSSSRQDNELADLMRMHLKM
jgi:transcriptional regulator